MSSGLLVGLEMALVIGGVLGLAIWELLRLRRDRAKAGKEREPQRAPGDESSEPEVE